LHNAKSALCNIQFIRTNNIGVRSEISSEILNRRPI
jgi:hypothetical protein